jgi:hypothetical protein
VTELLEEEPTEAVVAGLAARRPRRDSGIRLPEPIPEARELESGLFETIAEVVEMDVPLPRSLFIQRVPDTSLTSGGPQARPTAASDEGPRERSQGIQSGGWTTG